MMSREDVGMEEYRHAAMRILEAALSKNKLFRLISPICDKILRETTSLNHITKSACRGLADRYIPINILRGIWICNHRSKDEPPLSEEDKHLLQFQVQVQDEIKCIVAMCFLSMASLDGRNRDKLPQDSLVDAYRFEGISDEDLMFLTNFREFVCLSLLFFPPKKHKAFIMTIATHFEGREVCVKYSAGSGQTIHAIRRERIFEMEAKRMYPEYAERQEEKQKKKDEVDASPQTSQKGIRHCPETREHRPLKPLTFNINDEQETDIATIVANDIQTNSSTAWPPLYCSVHCGNDTIIFQVITHMRYLYGDIWHVDVNLQANMIMLARAIVETYRLHRSYEAHMAVVRRMDEPKSPMRVAESTLGTVRAAMLSCKLYCFYLLHHAEARFSKLKVEISNTKQSYLDNFTVWVSLAIDLSKDKRAMQRSVLACGRLEGSNRFYSFGSGIDEDTQNRKDLFNNLSGQQPRQVKAKNQNTSKSMFQESNQQSRLFNTQYESSVMIGDVEDPLREEGIAVPSYSTSLLGSSSNEHSSIAAENIPFVHENDRLSIIHTSPVANASVPGAYTIPDQYTNANNSDSQSKKRRRGEDATTMRKKALSPSLNPLNGLKNFPHANVLQTKTQNISAPSTAKIFALTMTQPTYHHAVASPYAYVGKENINISSSALPLHTAVQTNQIGKEFLPVNTQNINIDTNYDREQNFNCFYSKENVARAPLLQCTESFVYGYAGFEIVPNPYNNPQISRGSYYHDDSWPGMMEGDDVFSSLSLQFPHEN